MNITIEAEYHLSCQCGWEDTAYSQEEVAVAVADHEGEHANEGEYR